MRKMLFVYSHATLVTFLDLAASECIFVVSQHFAGKWLLSLDLRDFVYSQ